MLATFERSPHRGDLEQGAKILVDNMNSYARYRIGSIIHRWEVINQRSSRNGSVQSRDGQSCPIEWSILHLSLSEIPIPSVTARKRMSGRIRPSLYLTVSSLRFGKVSRIVLKRCLGMFDGRESTGFLSLLFLHSPVNEAECGELPIPLSFHFPRSGTNTS